jgi:hypothetical protein
MDTRRAHILDRTRSGDGLFRVYAVFYLSRVQSQQEQTQRHRQLVIYLEKEAGSSTQRDHEAAQTAERRQAELLGEIEKGAMPQLEPINWVPDYETADFGSLLQVATLEVFDVRTIAQLREVDAIARNGYATR